MNAQDQRVIKDSIKEANEIDLSLFFDVILDGTKTITLITFFITILSIIFAFSLPNMYQSESLLITRDSQDSGGLGQYSGLASFAGIIPDGGTDEIEEIIEIIKSREFVKHLISFEEILPSLMAASRYDMASKQLLFDETIYDFNNKEWIEKPNYLEVHRQYVSNILSISQDRVTKLISIKVEHLSPIFAERFLNLIIEETNTLKRNRDLQSSQKALVILIKELGSTPLLEIKESINQLIRGQLETQMMAKIHEDYSLIKIEPPFVPDKKSSPGRLIIVVLSAMLGLFLGIIYVIFKFSFFYKKIEE